jgi:uncharacterized protein YjhX (UPF0386 family)
MFKASKKKFLSYIVLCILVLSAQPVLAKDSPEEADFKNAQELMRDYPNIGDYSSRAENKKIICPFHRMLERAGVYDTKKPQNNSEIIVSIIKIAKKAREFGCKIIACAPVATLVSGGQISQRKDLFHQMAKLGHVNLTRLHKARGTAHECGLTFQRNGTQVSVEVRNTTLKRLKQISDSNTRPGELSADDLMKVKLEICKKQDVEISGAGKIEVQLIYIYLGGKDRGYVEYADVVRFLHAKMPNTKAIDGLSL